MGKISINLRDEFAAVDLLSFSAHKFHGPKGVGALFVRDAIGVAPILYGGGQQLGLRPGTENLASLIGMATALKVLTAQSDRYGAVEGLRNEIQRRILTLHPGAFALGAAVARLPNTLSICLPGMEGGDLVDRSAAAGIAIATGSACAHGANKPSHVVLAMGLSHDHADCCIRVSLSVETTPRDVEAFLDVIGSLISSNIVV